MVELGSIRESFNTYASRGRESLQTLYDNAPLLRHINPQNRYNQIPATEGDPSRTRTINGHLVHIGETSDGVFSNMSAKPSTNPVTIPEQLPSYSEASEDPSPPYWETSILSEFDEVYIDGLPTGNVFNLLWSAVVSVMFQFLGFVITYLLHTSHAAKNGSQIGLGLTMLNLGYQSMPVDLDKSELKLSNGRFEPLDPSDFDVSAANGELVGTLDSYHSNLQSHGDISSVNSFSLFSKPSILPYVLFCLGGFIVIRAFYDFVKVKRLEYTIMNPINNRNTEESESHV